MTTKTARESKIESHLKKEVEKLGGKVRKLRWIGKAGAPDRLMWFPAKTKGMWPRAAFVELKAPGKKPTKVQTEEHKKFTDDGWTVLVVDSIEAADKAINEIYSGKAPQRRVAKTSADIDVISPPDLPKASAPPAADLVGETEQDNSDLA